MQVFLSWSGSASHKVAQALNDFLGDVIQEIKPFLSSEGISKGQQWSSELGKRLAETNYGIICLTRDNLDAPWILFEAGALAKNIADSRVTALLLGIKPADVAGPLSQFQHTGTDRDEVLKLLQSLNEWLPEEKRLKPERLTRLFDRNWSSFESSLTEAMALVGAKSDAVPARDMADMVEEILELVRETHRQMGVKEPIYEEQPPGIHAATAADREGLSARLLQMLRKNETTVDRTSLNDVLLHYLASTNSRSWAPGKRPRRKK
jgi:hypothetical protein